MYKDILKEKPMLFRSTIAKGIKSDEPAIDRWGGDGGAGLIRGVSIITRGEALGHGVWIDRDMLSQVKSSINAMKIGTKARFTHPGLSGDGLGKYLGRFKNARIDGDVVRADLHFAESAHETPDGDLAGYVMSLAEQDPEAFGASIAYEPDERAQTQFITEHEEDGVFVSPDESNIKNLPHARMSKLRATDIVDEPAANPDGLFHRGQEIAEEAEACMSYALGLSDKCPTLTLLDIDPDRVQGFVQKYLDRHGHEISRFNALDSRFEDKEFVAEMYREGKSVEEATSEWNQRQAEQLKQEVEDLKVENEKQKAELEKLEKDKSKEPGPLTFAGSDNNEAHDFENAARQLAAAEGISLREAKRRIAREQPELYDAYRESFRGARKNVN